MIVSVRHRICDRKFVRHEPAGMGFDEMQSTWDVATQCGQSEACARDVVALCNSRPVAPIKLASNPLESSPWTTSRPFTTPYL